MKMRNGVLVADVRYSACVEGRPVNDVIVQRHCYLGSVGERYSVGGEFVMFSEVQRSDTHLSNYR